MCKLVQDCISQRQLFIKGHFLTSSEHVFRESNTGNIFHSAHIKLWNEDLIVFCELVWDSVEIFVEAHAYQGGSEHLIKNLWLDS